MKEFLEAIEKNPELKARLDALKDTEGASQADMIAIAKEYGFELTEEDFQSKHRELSDDELAAISAAGGCGCFGGGGGGYDGLDCWCAGAGFGYVDGATYITEKGGCGCALAGAGATNKEKEVDEETRRKMFEVIKSIFGK